MSDRHIMIIHETVAQSWMRDASSVAGFVALIGIGVWLDSGAMQWTGAILGFLVIAGRMQRVWKDNRYTIEQARKRLDEIEAEMKS
jgi:hypothetical protein